MTLIEVQNLQKGDQVVYSGRESPILYRFLGFYRDPKKNNDLKPLFEVCEWQDSPKKLTDEEWVLVDNDNWQVLHPKWSRHHAYKDR